MDDRDRPHAPRGEIRALTGLRGVAAIYVMVYHLLQEIPGTSLAPTLVRHGYIAVDLFFVLSGFVMAMIHGRDRFDREGYASFLGKRLARIYPLYAVITLATITIDIVAHIKLSPGRLAVNVALLQGWGVGTAIVPPSWSLSAEFGAYLLFPLLVLVMLGGSRMQTLLGTAAAFALLATISFVSPAPRVGPLDLYQGWTLAPLLRCIAEFVLGLAAYRLWCGLGSAEAASNRSWVSFALGLPIAALLAWRNSDLLIVALMVPLVAALAAGDGGFIGRCLSAPLLHRLGVLSFSIYLVHFAIREWVRAPLTAWLAGVGLPHPTTLATLTCCGAAIAIATLTYRLIERPARSMVRSHIRLMPHAS